LAEVGAYISKNKDGYNEDLLTQFRDMFATQKNKIQPVNVLEENNDATNQSAGVTV
jgi:hypothetical protein